MAKRILGKHYIKQWRELRGLSLERLANRMEVEPGGAQLISAMSLSRIERGKQPYSEELLNALSKFDETDGNARALRQASSSSL